ncbi:MAG TPA: histidine kinase [Gemmatimonadaceae bacterium]|nr:histidine kinase [Gemmatimonadaceae bacterium]
MTSSRISAASTTERGGAPQQRWWPLALGASLVLGVINSGQHYLEHALASEPAGALHAAARSVPWWLLWGLFTPVIARVVARFDPASGPPARRLVALGAHAAAAAALNVLHLLLYAAYAQLVPSESAGVGFVPLFERYLTKSTLNVFTYAGIAAGVWALEVHRRLREREVAAARLEARASALGAQLSAAQLDALRAQLHPHFLFNTLNAIAVLVQKGEGADAARMIARLGELLRQTMEHTGRNEVPLAEELELLECYVAIQRIRFRDRLQVELDAEPAALRGLVPQFCLQPLVENAIAHGRLASEAAGGGAVATVRVEARRQGGKLVLRVRDDGPGPVSGPNDGRRGLGLANTRARIEQLHGAAGASLELRAAEGGGAEVVMRIPFFEAEDAGDRPPAARDAAPALPAAAPAAAR